VIEPHAPYEGEVIFILGGWLLLGNRVLTAEGFIDGDVWVRRGLAAKHEIGHTTVPEIWQAFGFKPREGESKVSPTSLALGV
jgi:hypothetical protein